LSVYWELESFQEEVFDEEAPGTLGDLPLFVLSEGKIPEAVPDAGITLEDALAQRAVWDTLQDELTALSSKGQRTIAEGSGHVIQFEQPSIVIEKIVEMVKLIRQSDSG